MASSQVVLYFDKTEDALLFTLAASSVIAQEEPQQMTDNLVKIAEEIRKASRITTEGVLDPATGQHSRVKQDSEKAELKTAAVV